MQFTRLPKHLIHVDAVPWDDFQQAVADKDDALKNFYYGSSLKTELMVGKVLKSGDPTIEEGQQILIRAFQMRPDGGVNDFMQPLGDTQKLMDKGEYLAFTHACLAVVETDCQHQDISDEAAPLPSDT